MSPRKGAMRGKWAVSVRKRPISVSGFSPVWRRRKSFMMRRAAKGGEGVGGSAWPVGAGGGAGPRAGGKGGRFCARGGAVRGWGGGFGSSGVRGGVGGGG